MNGKIHFGRKAFLAVAAMPLFVCALATAAQSGERVSGPVRLVQDGAAEARLLLGFADRSGIYLSNVLVTIKDQRGNQVAELLTDGPWLDVQMSPGTYQVTAFFEGARQEVRNVRLNNRSTTTQVLYWDLNVPSPEMMAYDVTPINSMV